MNNFDDNEKPARCDCPVCRLDRMKNPDKVLDETADKILAAIDTLAEPSVLKASLGLAWVRAARGLSKNPGHMPDEPGLRNIAACVLNNTDRVKGVVSS